MNKDPARGFALLAALALVLATAAVMQPAGATPADDRLSFDAGVPAEYHFEPVTGSGVATVEGTSYDSVQAAVDAAESGDVVRLEGRFDERVRVRTPNLTLVGPPGGLALIDGGGEGDVLTIDAPNVTVRRLWIRNSGRDAADNDAGVWLNGTGSTVIDSRVSGVTFGVWVDGVDDVTIADNTIVGRESVRPLSYRGNGIQLWRTADAVVSDNRITDVRDGVYFSWASDAFARNNTMWDLRYGVHFMYSDDTTLVGNVAFGNDVGFALMVSDRLTLVNNTAFNNTGTSGHGILLKEIDHTTLRDNDLVGNRHGLFVYNSVDNDIVNNLVLANDVGVQLTAGSIDERVSGNTFLHNRQAVYAVIGEQVSWNGTDRGNFWGGARPVDRDGDGISEVRYRPVGLAEYVVATNPRAAVFSHSPAFDVVRLAESTFPVVGAPGVVDHHPLSEPTRGDWQRYYGATGSSNAATSDVSNRTTTDVSNATTSDPRAAAAPDRELRP